MSVRKMNKSSSVSSLCVGVGVGMSGSVHESDSKNVSTPCVGVVSRKRVCLSREERENNGKDGDKRMRLKKEDEYYLSVNNANLEELKAHLEALKLRMKEMKEKKKSKKK